MSVAGQLVHTMPRSVGWRSLRADGPLLLALVLPVLAFIAEGHVSLSLLDEGFLWYGAQRVLAGEVPLRDFQSYDIGRYYWSAGWMLLTGSTGILPVRAGNAVLAACATVIATSLARSGRNRSPLQASLAALTFALLMVPNEKVTDSFAALLLTGGLARWLGSPLARRRLIEFGVCLGVASTIGINHALYGVISLLLASVYLAVVRRESPPPRSLMPLTFGALLGYAPVLLCHLAVPGFTAAFVDSIRQLFEVGTTNLALPLPRLSRFAEFADSGDARRESLLALLFIAAPCFIAFCVRRLLVDGGARARPHAVPPARPGPAFVAAVIVSVPYAHYAYSRADFVHVVVSILPLLVAAWAFPADRWRRAGRGAVTAVAIACCAFLVTKHPGFLLLKDEPLEPVTVQGERLLVPLQTAAELRLLQRLADQHADGGQPIYAAPYWPGAYAALGRRSPTWEIYALFPALAWRQQREIERLVQAKVAMALVLGWQMDDRNDLGFEHTHPLVAAHVRRCLREEAVGAPNPVPRLRLYVADAQRCAPR